MASAAVLVAPEARRNLLCLSTDSYSEVEPPRGKHPSRKAEGLAPGGDGLVEVHAAVADVGGDGDGVGDGLLSAGFVAMGVDAEQQRGRTGNHRRTEGSPPTGGVGAEGIGGDDAFAGSGHPNDIVAVVGERRERVVVRS